MKALWPVKLNLTLHQRRSSVCLFAGSVTQSIPAVMGRNAASVGNCSDFS